MTRRAPSKEFLTPAPEGYLWPRCPEADDFVSAALAAFLARHAFARRLSEQMRDETSTHFSVWVDHFVLPARAAPIRSVEDVGYLEDRACRRPAGARVFAHPFADLPRLVISSKAREMSCAIAVEDIHKFQLAHGLSLPVHGAPYSGYRAARLSDGGAELVIVERRGSKSLLPEERDRAGAYLRAFERWCNRPRRLSDRAAGMKQTLQLARDLAKKVGTGAAAVIFLEGERMYWQSRNHAAQVQKARQDALGLGWANHDHHTFRSSRAHFPALIDILMTFGFKKRERYYAGADAGWGAQIMEQPESGLIIFADVDLAPEDVTVDFSKVALPELKKPGTVGLWCALHGESMLEAGMHHLEAQFDFDRLKTDLKTREIETMPPFSDFPFLRQAFTKAEMWPVPEARLERLRAEGKISAEAAAQIRAHGAVGSHLENLQRRDGFKGFNQKGVSRIISAVNPERLALIKDADEAA